MEGVGLDMYYFIWRYLKLQVFRKTFDLTINYLMKEFRPSSMSKLEIRRFKNICLISSESKLQYIQ